MNSRLNLPLYVRNLETPPNHEAEIKGMELLAAPHTIRQRGNMT